MFTSLPFLCLKKACTHLSHTCIILTVYRSQLYLMFKILEIVSVLMLALWLVLIKATWKKSLSTSAVLKGCMTTMLYSLETSGYIEERFLSLWSTDWNSSFKWVKDLLSEEDKIYTNSCHWMSRDSESISKYVAKVSISV
jgi:hypothetical protein